MTVTLELNPEIEQWLLAQARERGVFLNIYLKEIVGREVRNGVPPGPAKDKTLNLHARET